MHYGLIIYDSLDTVSGGYLYDRKLVDFLRRQGEEVEIISVRGSRYGRHLTHNFSPFLRRRLRQTTFDLLLQDELNHPSLFWLNRWLKRHNPIPIFSIVHHLQSSETRPAWQNRWYRLVERSYLGSVDGTICNSRTTQDEVMRLGGGRPSVVAFPAGDRFAPNLDDAAISARAHEPGPLRLIFVGNLIPRKGLPRLLAALAQLPPDVCRLDVVGDTAVNPRHTRAIQRQIADQQLEDRVDLHGRLADDGLARLLMQSHVLVVPSQYEGFGIVYLEGMGFGLPAIAGTGGATHEIITSGENGFLVGDPNARSSGSLENDPLVAHLQTLHQNRPQLAAMSLAARSRFEAHPAWDESMARIHDFLVSFGQS